MTQNKTKLLIIDDSALIRQTMSLMLKDNSFVEVVGTAFNPFSAVKKIEDLKSRIDKIEDKLNQMVIPVGKILLRCPNCDKWMVVIDTG